MPEFEHLQILHDELVERRILDIIPQIDNWLDGTLPLPKEAETSPEDPGVIFPTVEIDIPLRPIRDLIYSGIAEYALLRTLKDTSTPVNLSAAVYTVLRGTGDSKIGGINVVPGQSVWVECPTSLSADLIVMISKTTAVVVGLATRSGKAVTVAR
ncbi:hypothetical protein KXX16_003582 [Aspergillus fumigatus]|uniref:Uncharacterized protein n=2 Tax=Aspergillus subgen. Fumigati TaxID=2720872 RepID=A0A8H6UH99_9EURO|nr:hypothetical protein CNMCM5793_002049 [Aspergillus hiratsukae]KAH1355738.1 hypothetical protein KXX63_000781 [Aspergillus fumigatus]RHZ53870.1 hypothetical protein CDV55_101592 [Aspergillus turcosus]KAH1372152.1 hypothetical protein KXX50_004325 [Aspergillus fumigatus]KAH1399028.1 hypothetical protein KXX22_007214 [Aspergillus fumigatus]